jgi:protein subunit release factor A
MKTMTIELRAAEGGADARLFAAELAQSYLRLAIAKG